MELEKTTKVSPATSTCTTPRSPCTTRSRESGALSAARRANAIWKRLVAEYEPPPIDPGIAEALREYVAKRKRAIEAGEVALEQ